ncbi:hypothetical protein [Nostoc sp. UHCC 0251]|uniref:hypothetical protein n=1 Tax=Nostoc sp. UHCC 0251 TaxID=3110240 RepID=UPI002B1F5B58|nr:hypothetical protein [Nostoc sp. UHCC 0251]MEA5627570.1 hypothetical protein [Nostoc sp. UHCC 0251]
MENPRQFASLDASDAALHGSLTNRPASGVAAGDPIDFEAISARVRYERTLPNYEYKESAGEIADRLARQSAAEQRIRAETAETNERNRLLLEHEQRQRNELRNRISTGEPADVEVSQPRRESPLSQIQRSTPERQPVPSKASPPPTLKGTAARASAIVEPTATPAPAALKEAIANTLGGAANALPRSLPQAAGRLVIPGVQAGLTLGSRLIAGQPVSQAVAATAGTVVGGYVGLVVGNALLPGLGGVVGSMIGGWAGSLFSDSFFRQQLPRAAEIPEPVPGMSKLASGQLSGTLYNVSVVKTNAQGGVVEGRYFPSEVGRIDGILEQQVDATSYRAFLITNNGNTAHDLGTSTSRWTQISIVRTDGVIDVMPSPVIPAPPPDNRPGYFNESPLNPNNIIPTGTPQQGQPKYQRRDVAPTLPGNNLPNSNSPYFPGHGGLAPSFLPNPTQTPSNGGAMLPMMQPQRQLLPFAEPDEIPLPRLAPKSGVTVTEYPATVVPIEYAQITPSSSTGVTVTASEGSNALGQYVPAGSLIPEITGQLPSNAPQIGKAQPVSDALSPTPKFLSQPISKTPTELSNDKTKEALEQQKKDFDDQIKRLTAIATAIAALTPAINGIPDAIAKSPAVQAANKETTQGAVCEIAQPGKCLGDALDNSANKVNQNNNQNTANILDKINAGANAAQLALLELMNTKLGDLIPGGISGKLQRLSSWMHLDRVLNVLIWWQTLHNAYMLSANLGQTLTSAISNVLAAIGIKDAEGSPLEIGEILGNQFDSLAKSVIGESEWGGIKAEYKKWNRIYQAAANLMNSIQSIGYSILSALEVVGSWVAVIGNGLRKWGEVGENAYRWMNPTPNFQNKFFTALETTENVVSQIDSVASEVLSVQDTVTQIGTQKTEFLKALGQEPEGKQGTTPPEATQVKASSDASKLVSATGLAISDEDKEADE